MTVHDYGVDPDHSGTILELANGEYLRYESDDSFESYGWTTSKPVRDIAKLAVSKLGVLNDEDGIVAVADPAGVITVTEGPSDEVFEFAMNSSVEITYLRLAMSGMMFNWRRPYRRFERGPKLATTALYGAEVTQDKLVAMVVGSATEAIKAHPSRLLSKLVGEGWHQEAPSKHLVR